MQTIIDVVASIRNLRAQWNIKPQEKIQAHISARSKDNLALLHNNESIFKNMARIDTLTINQKSVKEKNAATFIVGDIKGAIPLGDLIDITIEKNRILGQITELTTSLTGLKSRLKNKDFLKKAPKDVVEKEKTRLESMTIKAKELRKIVAGLES